MDYTTKPWDTHLKECTSFCCDIWGYLPTPIPVMCFWDMWWNGKNERLEPHKWVCKRCSDGFHASQGCQQFHLISFNAFGIFIYQVHPGPRILILTPKQDTRVSHQWSSARKDVAFNVPPRREKVRVGLWSEHWIVLLISWYLLIYLYQNGEWMLIPPTDWWALSDSNLASTYLYTFLMPDSWTLRNMKDCLVETFQPVACLNL